MKKKLVVLLLLGLVGTGVPLIGVASASIVQNTRSQSEKVEKPSIVYDYNGVKVSVVHKKNMLSVKILNKSESKRSLNAVEVDSLVSNAVLLGDSEIVVGAIPYGSSSNIDIPYMPTGNSSIVGLVNRLGVEGTFILLVLGLLGGGVIYVLIRRKGTDNIVKLVFVGLCVVVTCGYKQEIALTKVTTGVNKTVINLVSEKGTNYIQPRLSFCEDVVKISESTREEPIKYKTKYELNSNKKVTDAPVIKIEGKDGTDSIKTTKTYINGRLEGIKEDKTVVTKPIDAVLEQGTEEVIVESVIKPKKVYVEDSKSKVGVLSLDTKATGVDGYKGKKEETKYWDEKSNSVKSKNETVIKKSGIEIWKAGTLLVDTKESGVDMDYVANVSLPVGETKVLEKGSPSSTVVTYEVEVSSKTGKRVDSNSKLFKSSSIKQGKRGKVEVGVLKTETKETPFKEEVEKLSDKWNNYEEVITAGSNTVVEKKVILGLDKKTGKVTDKVIKVVSNETVKKGNNKVVKRGTKEPNWVKETVIGEEIAFNTDYIADKDNILKGKETALIKKGKTGSIVSEYKVACNESGVPLEGYTKEVISEDRIVDPVNEVIMVAKDSDLISKEEKPSKPSIEKKGFDFFSALKSLIGG